jgi:hypothetical protein
MVFRRRIKVEEEQERDGWKNCNQIKLTKPSNNFVSAIPAIQDDDDDDDDCDDGS